MQRVCGSDSLIVSPRVPCLGIAALLLAVAFSAAPPAHAQQTLYRNGLSAAQNTLGNASGWSTSSTASGVTPTSITASDTLTFSNWWTPGKIAATKLWLDAADGGTVTHASGAVSTWVNKSGTGGNNATQGSVNPRPQFVTSGDGALNGRPSINFDGIEDRLTSAVSVNDFTRVTVFWVGRILGGNSLNGSYTGHSSFGYTGNVGLIVTAGTPPAVVGLDGRPNGGDYVSAKASLASGTAVFMGGGSYDAWANADGNGKLVAYGDGTESAATWLGSGGGDIQAASGVTLGWIGGDGWDIYSKVGIGEFLITDTVLSTADRQTLEGYLAWKWGTVSSLPANHPYKNAAPVSASESVYLGGSQSAAGLVFSAAGSATTLLGGTSGGAAANAMTLGAGGITVAAGAGATTLGAASGGTVSLVVGADQSWTNNAASVLRAFNGIGRDAGDTTSRTLTIAGSGDTQLDGAIADGGVAGVLGLAKTGAGVLTLTGTSSYSGPTTVSGGRLVVNGALGNTAVTVHSGGLLGGSASIAGGISVLAGGTFSPGNSPGLVSTGSLSLAGVTLMEIDGLSPRGATGGYDAVDVTGELAYGGTLLVDFGAAITTALADNTLFNLFDFGSRTGTFTGITTADDGSYYGGLTFTGAGDTWTATKGVQTLQFTHSTGNLVIVPEPGAIALAGLGIAAAAWARRRRAL